MQSFFCGSMSYWPLSFFKKGKLSKSVLHIIHFSFMVITTSFEREIEKKKKMDTGYMP